MGALTTRPQDGTIFVPLRGPPWFRFSVASELSVVRLRLIVPFAPRIRAGFFLAPAGAAGLCRAVIEFASHAG